MDGSDVLAIVALAVSVVTAVFSISVRWVSTRRSAAMAVATTLFAEHRSDELAAARVLVHDLDLGSADVEKGFAALGPHTGEVRALAWYYDNLGVYVAHRIVDVDLVAGYLGGSVIDAWERLSPLIAAERKMRRDQLVDPGRYQEYFENLVELVKEADPAAARKRHGRWKLPD